MAEIGLIKETCEKVGKLKGLKEAFDLARAVHASAQTRAGSDAAYAIAQGIHRKIEEVADGS